MDDHSQRITPNSIKRRAVGYVLLALGALALLWVLTMMLGPKKATRQPTLRPNTPIGLAAPTAPTPVAQHPPFFVHYYLWWDDKHWRSKLGAAYPYQQSSLPLPAELSADGCGASSAYQDNQLLDVPAAPLNLYSQDDPAVLDQHIHDAADAGISGFVVSWAGNGKPDQTGESVPFSRRLDSLVQRVSAYNASHPTKFYLMLGYEGLDNDRKPRPIDWITNDLSYFIDRYQSISAFHIPYYGDKLVMMLLDSRKFQMPAIATITSTFNADQRKSILIIGDEHGMKEWSRGVSDYFDGDGWYWSDENPYTNPNAFNTIAQLASMLRSQQKLWFAPLNGGYNKSNFGIGGSCILRNQGETMRRVYEGNKASAPNGWMYISWNEFYENTYVEPSKRYSRFYLDQLKAIITTN
jgi:hypothetical protein